MDFITTIVEFKNQLLLGLTVATIFGVVMYVCDPLIRRATRDEANRLILSEARLSRYVLIALAFGGVITGYEVLMDVADRGLPVTASVARFVFILNLIGLFGAALGGRLVAKRLAKQVLTRGPSPPCGSRPGGSPRRQPPRPTRNVRCPRRPSALSFVPAQSF
jgi:hypothetical protein